MQKQKPHSQETAIITSLLSYDIRITSISDLTTGIQLADLINQVFYENSNQQLANKIIRQEEHRKGNNIINLNIILKILKNDCEVRGVRDFRKSVQCLTAFTLMDDEAKMCSFVQWVLQQAELKNQCRSSDQKFDNIEINNVENSPKQQESGLQNLYFAADLSPSKFKSPPAQLNDSLDESGDKVVRKGSFKILKPRSDFNSNSPTKKGGNASPNVPTEKIRYDDSVEQKIQPEERKTIPKGSQKPPIYRMANKENTLNANQKYQNQKSFKAPISTPFSCESNRSSSHEKNECREQLKKQLVKLDKQIVSEQKSLKWQDRSFSAVPSSSKKIFKIDIKEVPDQERREIVQWLIGINLLNIVATNYYLRLHEICKNGVIFPEIINHQKGRGAELCYFKDPRRGAEMNSNYQKVFNYLKDVPTFNSELMFMSEFFIPEAQENAFWSFLKSMYHSFAKLRKIRWEQSMMDYEGSVKKRFPRTAGASTPIQNNRERQSQRSSHDPGYQKLKYRSSSQMKQTSHPRSQIKPRCQSQQKQRKSSFSKRKGSQKKIEFIKQLPAEVFHIKQQLVQISEPVQETATIRGYKHLYERKSKNYDTPKKSTSIINTSLSRSRILSMGSIRKSQQKSASIPSITLDMEMKALAYLKEKSHYSFFTMKDKQIFKDPLRNGVLINEIMKKDLGLDYSFYPRPKNIDDCRENYRIALNNLRRKIPELHPGYAYHAEQIIKGEKSLFYGLVCCISNLSNFNFGNREFGGRLHPMTTISNSNPSQHQNFTFSYPNRSAQNHIRISSDQSGQGFENQALLWVRDIEQYSAAISAMKIRDINCFASSIVAGSFLYQFLLVIHQKSIVTQNYKNPVTEIQQESNLKKIISFFVQNKMLSSEFLQKIRKIVKKDPQTLKDLLMSLMHLSKSKLNQKQECGSVTFVKYLRQDQKVNKSNENEGLDTTMANQSHHLLRTSDNGAMNLERQNPLFRQESKPETVEVKWMRKLGFSGDISLNSGVILCKILERLTMKSIEGVHSRPQSRAQALMNVRRAIKAIGGELKWDEGQILDANIATNLEIYKFLKDRFKHAYALKLIN